MTRTVKVAVIGSGLAGLTAAYRLSKTPRVGDVEFEVHLFEKASNLGMDSHSTSLNVPGYDSEYRVDVPMRSFQGGYYPQLIALYNHLGVKFRQRDFSYSFSTLFERSSTFPAIEPAIPSPSPSPAPAPSPASFPAGPAPREITTTMIYNGASGREGVGIPSSFFKTTENGSSNPMSPIFAYLLFSIRAYAMFAFSTSLLVMFYLRLVFHSLPIHINIPKLVTVASVSGATVQFPVPQGLFSFIPRRPSPYTTLREWTEMTVPKGTIANWLGLEQKWREFVSGVLILLFSAVCTASEELVWEMPVEEVLDYIYLTFGTHHYVVQDGIRDVTTKLTEWIPSKNIHLSTAINSLSLSTSPESPPPQNFRQFDQTIKKRRTVDIHCAGGQVHEGFDHIIFATQANQAAPLITSYLDTLPLPVPIPPDSPSNQTPQGFVDQAEGGGGEQQPQPQPQPGPQTGEGDEDEEEREELRIHFSYIQSQIACLSQFTYCPNIVVNHTDSTLLPSNSQDWRDLNLVVSSTPSAPDGPTTGEKPKEDQSGEERLVLPFSYTMATHVLSPPTGYTYDTLFHTLDSPAPSNDENGNLKTFPRIYQTTNPIIPPRQETIMSVARLERAIVDLKAKRALKTIWREKWDTDASTLDVNEDGDSDGGSRRGFDWRWGTAGSDGGILGPLQGAGKVLPLPPDSDSQANETGGKSQVVQDVPGVWLCGSYAHAGIPLLEGCVISARNVVEQGIWAAEGLDANALGKLW